MIGEDLAAEVIRAGVFLHVEDKKLFFLERMNRKLRIVYRHQLPTSLFELRRDKLARYIEAFIKRNH